MTIPEDSRYIALLDETYKRLGTTFLLYLLLAFSAFVMAFSKALPPTQYFLLPIINIQMNKWNSIEVLSLLVFLVLFRLTCLYVYSKILRKKIQTGNDLYCSFPTMLSIFEILFRINYPRKIVDFIFFLMLFFSPLIILIYAGWARVEKRISYNLLPFGVSWIMIFICAILITGLSGYILLFYNKRSRFLN